MTIEMRANYMNSYSLQNQIPVSLRILLYQCISPLSQLLDAGE